MKKYEAPVIEVAEFDVEDVITASSTASGGTPSGGDNDTIIG